MPSGPLNRQWKRGRGGGGEGKGWDGGKVSGGMEGELD
jgi:hypothetical protein